MVFAVPDMAAAASYLTDYGLLPTAGVARRYEALDGTGIQLVAEDNPAHPNTLGTANQLRKVIYGVADAAALEAVAAELAKDREVKANENGSIEAIDDLGFALGFQLTCRQAISAPGEQMNIPGATPQRPRNVVGVNEQFTPQPRTLSHFALFVPDLAMAEDFYARLGFRITDRLGGNPFLRPAGTDEHHTMFLIKTPPFMKGGEHLAFHVSGPGEVMRAGARFSAMGHESSWGPGRHIMGSNWFWYFKSPLGVNVEYDADMDKLDDDWVIREMPFSPDNAQIFLLEEREKFVPGGPPPGAAAH